MTCGRGVCNPPFFTQNATCVFYLQILNTFFMASLRVLYAKVAPKACKRSSMISPGSSSPTDNRINPGVIPSKSF